MSRERILQTLRSQSCAPSPLPDLRDPFAARPGGRVLRFSKSVEAAGGQCLRAAGRPELKRLLAENPAFAIASRRASVVPGLGDPNVTLGDLDDPRRLADVGFALLPGAFGVAENGAVWIDASAYLHRAVLFLPEHLGLVVAADQIVNHMHDAYERLDFEGPGFGCFVSGPSKTADIEQALVVGAHGARSVTVFVLEAGSRS